MYYIIAIEIIIVVLLVIYAVIITRKINKVTKSKRKVEKLYILKKMIEISSDPLSVSEKLKKINEIILDNLGVDNSTIIYFNGIEYVVKASNENEETKNTLLGILENKENMKELSSNSIKYVNVSSNEDREKMKNITTEDIVSMMFCPLYYDDEFVGMWYLSSSKEDSIEKLSEQTLVVLKDAIRETISSLGHEKSLETMIRDDKYTELKTNEYMLSNGKDILDKKDVSTIVMLKIMNIEKVNVEESRDIGNMLIQEVSKKFSNMCDDITKDAITVRYNGPILVSAIVGKKEDEVFENVAMIKDEISKIVVRDNNLNKEISPDICIQMMEYKKGSELDEIEKKLENLLTKNI